MTGSAIEAILTHYDLPTYNPQSWTSKSVAKYENILRGYELDLQEQGHPSPSSEAYLVMSARAMQPEAASLLHSFTAQVHRRRIVLRMQGEIIPDGPNTIKAAELREQVKETLKR